MFTSFGLYTSDAKLSSKSEFTANMLTFKIGSDVKRISEIVKNTKFYCFGIEDIANK